MKVAVLGGGMAGVLSARLLNDRGYDVHVFEAAPRIGGLCRSDVVDGFVFDVAGGHVLHSHDRSVLNAMTGVLENPVECTRNTKIFYRDRYVKYPFENGLADLPPNDNYECLRGYIDAHIARRDDAAAPETFREWIRWRFGSGMAELFMEPYNEKIWCYDLDEISSAWCSGRVPEAPLDDVLRASLGLESEGYQHQSTFIYPRRGGFESIVSAFAAGLEQRIRTSTPVEEVMHDASGFVVNGESFDRVINTLPLKILFPVLQPRPPGEVSVALDRLRHLSLATVLVAVNRENLSPYSWVYLPHRENGPMNRITHLNNYSPNNAPDGRSSILAEITTAGEASRPDLAALEAQVVRSLADMEMLDASEVAFTRSFYSEYAYPVHDVGFPERIAAVLEWLEGRGIVSLGRFARYRYVNTDQVYAMVHEAMANDFSPLN